MKGEKQHILVSCRCVGTCAHLGMEYWPDDDPVWGELYVAATRPGSRWRDRLKATWTILRGREHVLHGICLERPDVERLRDFLDGTLRVAESCNFCGKPVDIEEPSAVRHGFLWSHNECAKDAEPGYFAVGEELLGEQDA